jgi:hypothetical protein
VKNKRQLAVLSVLVAVAGFIWFRFFEGDRATVPTDVGAATQNIPLLQVENDQLRYPNVERARKTEYKSAGRNIFSAVAPPPLVVKQANAKPKPEKSGPMPEPVPPPPPPPVLPVKFFGFGVVPNGTARLAFFTDGEETYVVGEGEIFLKHFRILKIGNASLEFEDTSTGLHGTAPLQDQGTGGPQA